MALAIAPERGRKRTWWDERDREKAGVSFLEKLAAIPHPNNNHHSSNSEMQVDWDATLREIYGLIFYNHTVEALRPLSPEEAKMWKNHWESVGEFYAAQNTAGSKTLESHISPVFNRLGAPVKYVANALGYAGRSIGNAMGKAFSILPVPVKRYGLAGSLSTLYLAAMACNGQATPTPINTPTSSPTAAATATPAQTYKPTSSPTTAATATPTQTYKPTPSPTATPTQTSTPTPIPLKYLTNAEKEQLTGYFEKISNGWHQPSVDAANNLLSNESLGPEAWKSFFQGYFSRHAFTNSLREYLGYPVYWWFSETAHANLQKGLFGSLTDIINNQTGIYLQSEKTSLTRESPIIQSIINSHRFLNDMIRLQAPGVSKQQDIFNFYRTLAEDKGLVGLIYGNAPLDVNKYPFAGALRAQAHMNLSDALEHNDQVRDQIINILGLQGVKQDIFKNYGVLVTDNQELDATQLQVIKSLLDSAPNGMYNLRHITVNEFIGNTYDKELWFLNKAGVNIFGVRVGNAVENGFPGDVLPYNADVFSLVVAHELNHRVKASYIDKNSALKEREEALLKQAGSDPQNYLRSMVEYDFFKEKGRYGFFQQAPQEFFASISNQYFANSAHTLELGLERLAQGRTEPLNQFLFFADVYSRGGSSTLFYTLDTSGNLTHRDIPIERDNLGRVTRLYVGSRQYAFQLDSIGNVVSVNQLGGN